MEMLISLEKSLLDPQVRQDRSKLNDLIADDFMEIGASGDVFGKAKVLTELPQEDGAVLRIPSDFEVREISSDVRLVTFKMTRTEGVEVRVSLRSSLWAKRGVRWQMVFHQGTMVAR